MLLIFFIWNMVFYLYTVYFMFIHLKQNQLLWELYVVNTKNIIIIIVLWFSGHACIRYFFKQ